MRQTFFFINARQAASIIKARPAVCIILATLLLASCSEASKRRREMDARWEALRAHQTTELQAAQDDLRRTDSLLQLTQHELDRQQAHVDSDKAALKATAEELTRLTQTRILRDSLRTRCEALGGKIRYIRQKVKEVKSEE